MEMKCKDCRWLQGKERTKYGIECMNPKKRKKWAEQERKRQEAGFNWTAGAARYKQPAAPACKLFEAKKKRTEDEN